MTWQDMIERFERLEGRVAALEKQAGGEAVAGGLKQTKEYASVSEMVHDLAGEEFATEFDESIAQPRYASGELPECEDLVELDGNKLTVRKILHDGMSVDFGELRADTKLCRLIRRKLQSVATDKLQKYVTLKNGRWFFRDKPLAHRSYAVVQSAGDGDPTRYWQENSDHGSGWTDYIRQTWTPSQLQGIHATQWYPVPVVADFKCGVNIEQEQSAATAKSLGQIVETARACNWDKTTLAEAVAAHIRSTEVAPLRDELANACAVNEELNRDIAGYSEMLAAERQRADAAESRCECLSKNLSSVNAKLRELENWQREQMQVESEWDAQDIAKQLGGWPGQSCRKVISDKVPLLIANVKRLERERDAAIAEADEAKNEARRWYQQFKGL